MKIRTYIFIAGMTMVSCSKKDMSPGTPPVQPSNAFTLRSVRVSDSPWERSEHSYYNVGRSPVLSFAFSTAVKRSSVDAALTFKDNAGASVPYSAMYIQGDSALIIQPANPLKTLTGYTLILSTNLQSTENRSLPAALNLKLTTEIDSTDKFSRITDSALLTLVQRQTFKYFWDLGSPVSGLARERASGDVVTTGGSGFGIMAILVGIRRNFISREDALTRITAMVNFLADTTKVTRYHGAFSHWLNGSTGATVPFGTQDNGGDIVETSYLMQGLLCARQYFNNSTDPQEMSLRDTINKLWDHVDWSWYRQNNQNSLYWNWSPDYSWAINLAIRGWNEALITYVLAASANKDSIPRTVYDAGWARNGAMSNGKSFYGIQLPLGPDLGGPLFFAHYSFLGIDPHGLTDAYANYWTQDTAHAKINYLYCVNNPGKFNGYSNLCWGLTASDEQNGYSAHAPDNDDGVISPTAAVSSLPYTPAQSMDALRFFYYQLGDKLWGQYGFVDAFNLTNPWFDNDFLAIDQGPEIVMIENYRSGMLWDLFMSCPEIITGMKKLGFQSPRL